MHKDAAVYPTKFISPLMLLVRLKAKERMDRLSENAKVNDM